MNGIATLSAHELYKCLKRASSCWFYSVVIILNYAQYIGINQEIYPEAKLFPYSSTQVLYKRCVNVLMFSK